jgi:hypothetical protein
MTDISLASAALVAWLGTAALGLVMLVTWIADGGPGAIRFAPVLIFSHFLLAGAGLLVWVAYLFSGTRALAWVALGDLGLVALLGDFTLLRWFRLRRTGNGPGRGARRRAGPQHKAARVAGLSFPVPVVVVHGLLAIATITLVLLTALGFDG